MSKPWMIDELAHAGPEHLDPGFITGYDRKQGRPDPEEALAAFESHGVGDSATVVDLGAGTGQFALAAAKRFGRVVAADISPAMVAHLREQAVEQGLGNLEIVRAGFLSYEHSGELVDGVHTRHALHQLPDFWKTQALGRIAAILRPGGVLQVRDLIYDFQPDQAPEIFDGWLARASADPAAGYTAEDYIEHIQTEYSTFRWLFEPMLEAAGFEIVAVAYEASVFGSYTCLKR
ncbi:class I SAM-dependent methyltransferase [Flindersiella endophytica]